MNVKTYDKANVLCLLCTNSCSHKTIYSEIEGVSEREGERESVSERGGVSERERERERGCE